FSHNLVVKNGSEGAYLWDGEVLMHQPAFLNAEVVDCIGAGDSFNAGFILQFIKGASLSESLKFGTLTGAISTTAAGGTGAFADVASLPEISRKKFNTSFF
ncbi:MAG TPA: PfkB family carbohydrate kinase, partial [Bacteroidales bacterium]|nr:PfkB family carbohydrate kinase [Bacteroidales bacterium]